MTENVKKFIKSEEAEKMLQMVTAGFYDNSELALRMFQGIGSEYDEMKTLARELAFQAFPQTCTKDCMGIWESLYGITPNESIDIECRRKEVRTKKLQSQRTSMNPKRMGTILSTLTGCPKVQIFENIAPYTFRVEITLTGEQTNLDIVVPYINRIKPSHLSFQVVYLSNTHENLSKYKHEQLNQFTHKYLMNSVLP